MTQRAHGNMPALREGCFPQSGWQHPPHDFPQNRDGLTVRKIRPEQLPDTFLPVVTDLSGTLVTAGEGDHLVEICTSNGWRCYLYPDPDLLLSFLALAGAGYYGVHYWMQGDSYETALTKAADTYQAAEERREQARAATQSHTEPEIGLDLDDIEL